MNFWEARQAALEAYNNRYEPSYVVIVGNLAEMN